MSPPRILVADDDVDFAEAIARRCRNLGLTVDTVHDTDSARAAIERTKPDLAILDVNMPAGNGLDVCETAGNGLDVCETMIHHRSLASIPAIILTGRTDEATVRRCHYLCAYYVTKCGDVWPRIEPLLRELLAPPQPTGEATRLRPENDEIAPWREPGIDLHAPVKRSHLVDETFGSGDTQPVDSAAPPFSTAMARPSVLCIDDDPDFARALTVRLNEHDVDVIEAGAGRDGFRAVFTQHVDAIILDYELPEGNGLYVLRRLKENPVTAAIPVIVLTGRRDSNLERQVYNVGATRYLTKPLDWPQLWETLQDNLERHRAPAR